MTPECSCQRCVNACYGQPGRFMPGQAEQVAEHFGISFTEFAEVFLYMDWQTEHAWTPKSIHDPKFVTRYASRCVFLTESNKCSIHAVKPFECANWSHDIDYEKDPDAYSLVHAAWRREG